MLDGKVPSWSLRIEHVCSIDSKVEGVLVLSVKWFCPWTPYTRGRRGGRIWTRNDGVEGPTRVNQSANQTLLLISFLIVIVTCNQNNSIEPNKKNENDLGEKSICGIKQQHPVICEWKSSNNKHHHHYHRHRISLNLATQRDLEMQQLWWRWKVHIRKTLRRTMRDKKLNEVHSFPSKLSDWSSG